MPSLIGWKACKGWVKMQVYGQPRDLQLDGEEWGPFFIHLNTDTDGKEWTLSLTSCGWAVIKGLSKDVLKKMAVDLNGTGSWLMSPRYEECRAKAPAWVKGWIRECLQAKGYVKPKKPSVLFEE